MRHHVDASDARAGRCPQNVTQATPRRTACPKIPVCFENTSQFTSIASGGAKQKSPTPNRLPKQRPHDADNPQDHQIELPQKGIHLCTNAAQSAPMYRTSQRRRTQGSAAIASCNKQHGTEDLQTPPGGNKGPRPNMGVKPNCRCVRMHAWGTPHRPHADRPSRATPTDRSPALGLTLVCPPPLISC